jgi:plasmid stabilization system protein ParE
MTRRYALAPQAARDLVQIWRYVKREVSRGVRDLEVRSGGFSFFVLYF